MTGWLLTAQVVGLAVTLVCGLCWPFASTGRAVGGMIALAWIMLIGVTVAVG